MKSGQDRWGGSPHDFSSGTRTERTTVAIKVRLSPKDADRLKLIADVSGRTISGSVVALMDAGGSRVSSEDSPPENLATVGRLANAIYGFATGLQTTRADLGRCAGLLRIFFSESPAIAESHRQELNDAIFELRMSTTAVDGAIKTASAELAALRTECGIVAKRLARM